MDEWQQFKQVAENIAKEENFPLGVLLGQAALETGRRPTNAPGNNWFGIKGSGTGGSNVLGTKEQGSNGLYSTKGRFAAYAKLEDGIRRYISMIKSGEFKEAWKVWEKTKNPFEFVKALKKHGYATDNEYVAKVINTPEFQGWLASPEADEYYKNVKQGDVLGKNDSIYEDIKKLQDNSTRYNQVPPETPPIQDNSPINLSPPVNRAIRNTMNYVNQPFEEMAKQSPEIIKAAGNGDYSQQVLNAFPKASEIAGEKLFGGLTRSNQFGKSVGGLASSVATGPVQLGVGLSQIADSNTRKKGYKNSVVGAIKSALTSAGIKNVNTLNAVIGALVGAGVGKVSGQDPFKLAGKGIGETINATGLSKVVDPAIFGASGYVNSKFENPITRQAVGRAMMGAGNLFKDEFLSKIDGIQRGLSDRALSIILGATSTGGGIKDWEDFKDQMGEGLDMLTKKKLDSTVKMMKSAGVQPRDVAGRYMENNRNQEFIKDPYITDAQRNNLQKTLKNGVPYDYARKNMTIEQINESAGGWAPGERVKADTATFLKNHPDIAQQMPVVPAPPSRMYKFPVNNPTQLLPEVKSAEEFVKAQPTLYHGTGETFDQIKSMRQLRAEGSTIEPSNIAGNSPFIHLSEDANTAKGYSIARARNMGGKPTVREYKVQGNILNLTKHASEYTPAEKQILTDMGNKLWESSGGRGMDARIAGELKSLGKTKGEMRNAYLPFMTIEHSYLFPQLLKENGYGGFKFQDSRISGGYVDTIAALPENVKTPSQLTDIWNKSKIPEVQTTRQTYMRPFPVDSPINNQIKTSIPYMSVPTQRKSIMKPFPMNSYSNKTNLLQTIRNIFTR